MNLGKLWIELAQDREKLRAILNPVMKLRVQKYARNSLTCCRPVNVSRMTPFHAMRK